MTTFKVGQRVKIRADIQPHEVNAKLSHLIGTESITLFQVPAPFTGHGDEWWALPGGPHPSGHFYISAVALIPLTDPKAEEFIESLERLGREPQDDAPRIVQPTRATIMERDPDYYRED